MYRVRLVAEVSQTLEEEEVVPHVVQIISPPFLGRLVLTAGPAKFGMDLTKHEHGVRLLTRQLMDLSICLLSLSPHYAGFAAHDDNAFLFISICPSPSLHIHLYTPYSQILR